MNIFGFKYICFVSKAKKMADSMLIVKYLVFLQQIFNQSD
jgi:hypothetical protein